MEIKAFANFFEELIDMDEDIEVKNCEIKELKKRRAEMINQFIKDMKALEDDCDLNKKDLKFAYDYYVEARDSEEPDQVFNSQWDLVAQLGQYLQKTNQ